MSDQLIRMVLVLVAATTSLVGSYSPSVAGSDSDALETTNVPTLPTAAPTRGPTPTARPPQLAEAPEVAQPTILTPPATLPAPAVTAPVAPAPAAPGSCHSPAQILNLTNWKLTLPIGSAAKPLEIKQPGLATYANPPLFQTASTCDAVQFRAAVNGVTTSGSKNPRSELREMTGNGSAKASWSSTSGTHTLAVTEAFTRLPDGKPHLVGAQIHDSSDDVSVFRLEGANLYITDGNTPHHKLVTSDYALGTRFEAKFVVSGGQIKVYFNGALQTTLSKDFSGGYFKAGAYTQANCSNVTSCGSNNYGETMIYNISATHS